MLDLAVGMEGHPDNVAAALLGGIVVASGSNGRIEAIRMDPPDGMKAVVVVPDFEVPTPEAREALPQQVSFGEAVVGVGHSALLVAALAVGDRRVLREAMRDRLHQPYREPLIPGMQSVFRAAFSAGASGVAISGAGPSLVALTWEHFEAVAAAMKAAWSAFGVNAESLILDPCPNGSTVEIALE
jgi:homoserine kinase